MIPPNYKTKVLIYSYGAQNVGKWTSCHGYLPIDTPTYIKTSAQGEWQVRASGSWSMKISIPGWNKETQSCGVVEVQGPESLS